VLSFDDDRIVVTQLLDDEAVVLRAWRGLPTSAPSLPAWAASPGIARGEATRQTGGPAGSENGAGLHVHVDRLRWPSDEPPPWASLLGERQPTSVHLRLTDVPEGELRVVGSAPELGAWTPSDAPSVAVSADGSATLTLELPAGEVAAFKLVVLDPSGAVSWEPRSDRYLHVPQNEAPAGLELVWGR